MKYKKGQDGGSKSLEAIGERKRDLLEAARKGLLWCVESIFQENGCFVNVNSLYSTCIAKGGSRREGGGRGGGARTGGNVASSNENFPFLASPSLLQLTSEPMRVTY